MNSVVAGAALALAGAVAMPPEAQADPAAVRLPQVKVTQRHTVGGKGAARFDWLARANPNPARRPNRVVVAGSSRWVCSPAGGGAKSRCYSR
ncbi:hypothetical protein FHY55_05705 [Oceanicola sp. D3]|nr:hypothetical protein FHY55_05705 [Oceanicola sp. D3]